MTGDRGAGALSALFYMYARGMKADPGMIANGMLAGLVAITAPCAFVTSTSSVLIGAIAGLLVIFAYNFVDKKLKIDDYCTSLLVLERTFIRRSILREQFNFNFKITQPTLVSNLPV